ncbi:LysR substrate-binding domain-containing protein [Paenibacillus popilliae]|uniref:Transcriptional regulator n=1 Tax=Paenibacillus popilliae ATCC 14706 TaxID=1212764 RepID=M9M3B5_PAEPP|nr:LysR substrate-binding domain-containing protein [Paenibacillus popilliae]GAC43509.1 transcriptional regulator [Paenibacillus popilliae ATCC 14706]
MDNIRQVQPHPEQDKAKACSWILRESGSGTRSYSEQFIRELGVEPKRTYVFNSSQGGKEAVLAGLGITLLSRWVIHSRPW